MIFLLSGTETTTETAEDLDIPPLLAGGALPGGRTLTKEMIPVSCK